MDKLTAADMVRCNAQCQLESYDETNHWPLSQIAAQDSANSTSTALLPDIPSKGYVTKGAESHPQGGTSAKKIGLHINLPGHNYKRWTDVSNRTLEFPLTDF